MALQYISDDAGRHTAVIIPIAEWNDIKAKHSDIEKLLDDKKLKTRDASRFKGLLTDDEAEKYHQHLKKARSEWDRDI